MLNTVCAVAAGRKSEAPWILRGHRVALSDRWRARNEVPFPVAEGRRAAGDGPLRSSPAREIVCRPGSGREGRAQASRNSYFEEARQSTSIHGKHWDFSRSRRNQLRERNRVSDPCGRGVQTQRFRRAPNPWIDPRRESGCGEVHPRQGRRRRAPAARSRRDSTSRRQRRAMTIKSRQVARWRSGLVRERRQGR